MNMIMEARCHATVESFYAPYSCPQCGLETRGLLEVAVHAPRASSARAAAAAVPVVWWGHAIRRHPQPVLAVPRVILLSREVSCAARSVCCPRRY